jgi:glutamate decarboxylase
MEGDRFHLSPELAAAHCDDNTIDVVAVLGLTFDGSYEPVAEICAALDRLQADRGWDIPVHVDGASGGMIAPFCDPDLQWDFRLPRVASINTSGHKYGLVYPGVGWALWRDADALPADLVFKVNYLGGEMHVRPELLPARRTGGRAVRPVPAQKVPGDVVTGQRRE